MTEMSTIYIRLLNEGTIVYRPVEATYIGKSHYRLREDIQYDSSDEEWEFPPGTIVECKPETHGDKEIFVAIHRVS